MTRRADTAAITRAEARGQLSLFLAMARPEKVTEVTAEELERRFMVPRAEIEAALANARQGRLIA